MSKAPLHPGTTILDSDWSAMFKAHRALGHYHGNSILRQIRERVAAQYPTRSVTPSADNNSVTSRPKTV